MKGKLLIVHNLWGFQGGAEQYIFESTTWLKDYFDLFYLCEKKTGKDEELFSRHFLKVYQLNFNGYDSCEASKRPFVELLESERFDVVYIHKCLSLSFLEVALASGIPLIRMVHDHEIYCLRKYKYFPLSRRICTHKGGLCCLFPGLAFIDRNEQGFLRLKNVHYFKHKKLVELDQQCALFFVGSNYMKRELIHQGYSSERIHLFPPLIHLDFPINSKAIAKKSGNLLFIGQLVRGKGLDCLLQALALVKSDFTLRVVGSGSHKDYCQQLAVQLGLGKKIDFVGFVPHHLIASHCQEAFIGILPSVWPEPFSIVCLEMMQQALPIIAFDSGGISDSVDNGINGFLIPWMDIATMAGKIEFLLNYPEEAIKMGQAGREMFFLKYNFDIYKSSMLALFRQFYSLHTS